MKKSGIYFEPLLAQKFIMEMSKLYGLPSPYAIGSFVLLNTGEKAVITQKDSEYTLRPTVLVIENALGKPDTKRKINLYLDSSRYIVRSITEIDEIEKLKIIMI